MPVTRRNALAVDAILLLFLLLCAVGLLLWSQPVSAAVHQSVTVCTRVLLPALFPFLVLSNLLIGSGALQRFSVRLEPLTRTLFDLPGCFSAPILLGAVGGYPVGAKTVVALYRAGGCTREDALQALTFCNNGGPAFFIGALGAGLLHDTALGVRLYLIHLLAALLIGMLYPRNKRTVKQIDCTVDSGGNPKPLSLFLGAVTDGFGAFLNLCAFVLLFSVLICLLRQLPGFSFLPQGLQGLLCGLLELTSGAGLLCAASLPESILCAALSFLSGWGGLSVQLQSLSLLGEAGLSGRRCLWCKLLQGVLAAGLSVLLC